ncbi:unnamed protein product, partial [Amoebophrya sp. A120]
NAGKIASVLASKRVGEICVHQARTARLENEPIAPLKCVAEQLKNLAEADFLDDVSSPANCW